MPIAITSLKNNAGDNVKKPNLTRVCFFFIYKTNNFKNGLSA